MVDAIKGDNVVSYMYFSLLNTSFTSVNKVFKYISSLTLFVLDLLNIRSRTSDKYTGCPGYT